MKATGRAVDLAKATGRAVDLATVDSYCDPGRVSCRLTIALELTPEKSFELQSALINGAEFNVSFGEEEK